MECWQRLTDSVAQTSLDSVHWDIMVMVSDTCAELDFRSSTDAIDGVKWHGDDAEVLGG